MRVPLGSNAIPTVSDWPPDEVLAAGELEEARDLALGRDDADVHRVGVVGVGVLGDEQVAGARDVEVVDAAQRRAGDVRRRGTGRSASRAVS